MKLGAEFYFLIPGVTIANQQGRINSLLCAFQVIILQK